MNRIIIYTAIFILLLLAEIGYFRIARRFDIVDRPNYRSSHSRVVIRGGGVIFTFGVWLWAIFSMLGLLGDGMTCPWVLAGLTLISAVSFADDIRSMPLSVRLVVQFAAMGMMLWQLRLESMSYGLFPDANLLVMGVICVISLVVCVGVTNVYNFMDGINGITGGYSIAVLLPLLVLNESIGFMEQSLLVTVLLSVTVFCLFNFLPKGRAGCFAGDVGSIGMAFIVIFALGSLAAATGDVTYFPVFLVIYGVDACLTICHRVMLHEHLGKAHRKHAYQIMANELHIGHVKVSCLYAGLQLAVSMVFILLVPSDPVAHWLYLAGVVALLSAAYIVFMKKFYHLHEEYLSSINK